MSQNTHGQHRERMKLRARKSGYDHFSDHELLEVLLYFAIPRVDTNPIAHALLEQFGSIKAVLNASVDELCRVEGVGESSALLIRLLPAILTRYEAGYFEKIPTYRRMSDVVQFLHPHFCGLSVERVYLMMFNNRMNLIDYVLLSEGDVNCSEASVRKITELVLNKKVSAVLLAHNHPDGFTLPSAEDLRFTDLLNSHLGILGVVLVEHIIFAGMHYRPVMKNHCGTFRCSPLTKKLESAFYESFYDREESQYMIQPFFYTPTAEELMPEQRPEPVESNLIEE